MIKLNDDFYIKTEQYDYSAWVFASGKNPKTKEIVRSEKLIGYYPNVLSCLEAIRKYKVHKSIADNDLSLENAISLIRKVDNDFLNSLGKVEIIND